MVCFVLLSLEITLSTIDAGTPISFFNTRAFYGDLETAESRYKVAAKPVPYKPLQPAPAHFEGVTPTLPTVTKPQESLNSKDETKPSPTLSLPVHNKGKTGKSFRNTNAPKAKWGQSKHDRKQQSLLPKVTLKEFLENKKKQKLLLEKEEEVLSQVKKQQIKGLPKTKYETDTVIYPTTTYRPQTFHSSDIAKELGLKPWGSSADERNKKKQRDARDKNRLQPKSKSNYRPNNYVEATNYKPQLAFGVRKSRENSKSKHTGKSRRLKKVRRKKKFNKDKNSGLGPKQSNREQNSFRLKQKELKLKYQQRESKKTKLNKPTSNFNKKEPKQNKYTNKWRSKNNYRNGKELRTSYGKTSKAQKPSKARGTEFADNTFSSSLFLEDSTGVGGTLKSIRRATKPPKYHGYDDIAKPTSSYAAPADYYGGITAYNALLSGFEPLDADYIDTPPATPLSPHQGTASFLHYMTVFKLIYNMYLYTLLYRL